MPTAIHLLGVPRVVRNDHPASAPRGQKAWALLAYMLLGNRPVSRPHLAGLLFSDANDPLGALRWNLSELRRTLGEPLRGETLALPSELEASADVHVLARGDRAAALTLPGLDRDLLEGMSFASSPSFDVWLGAQRRHLQALAEGILRDAACSRLADGKSTEAAALAARLVARDPLDESGQVLLVRALVAGGNVTAAERQAADCRALFRRELGVAPGPALDEALRSAPALITRATRPPLRGRSTVAALVEAGEAAIGAGALEVGLQRLRRAVTDADALDNALLRTRARVSLAGALVHAARGRDEEGALVLHEALVAGEAVAPELAAAASRELGYIDFLRGRYDCALTWLQRAMPLANNAPLETARILTVHGSVLTDTAHYAEALEVLHRAVALSEEGSDMRQLAYAISMLGRAMLLRGDLVGAADQLDRSLTIALRAEVQLLQGDDEGAGEQFERAFALSCQIGDPCWEGLAGRGLGLVAWAAGDVPRAVTLLQDAADRSMRLQDAYIWVRAYTLELLCRIGVANALPQTRDWLQELQQVAARCGLREFTVRAQLHLAALGDSGGREVARLLALTIDNPVLHAETAALTLAAKARPV
jgi:DNA-binding SARP family transcriptional activator